MVGLALADLGADVIRCGAIGNDPLSAALERGKRVVDVGLDPDTLFELVRGADVAIEPDGAPTGLARAFQSTAIQLSLPAFPTLDPRFAGKAADEGTVLAAAGVLAERGPSNRLRGLGPALMPIPIASAYAAAFGTLGIVAGVFGRQESGRGDAIEVSLFGALMEGFSYNHLKVDGLPSRYADPRSTVGDAVLPLAELQVQALIDPMYRAFLCADDAWFYVATPPHRGIVERTLRLFGLWDGLLAEGLPTDDPFLSTRDWKDSAEGSIFGYPQLAPRWRERICAGIASVMRAHSVAHWEKQFAAHGLCGSRVQSSAAWLASPEARAAGLAIGLHDPLAGPMSCPGPFAWANGGVTPRPREIVSAVGLSWRGEAWKIPAPGTQKPFLSGVSVLDLCNVIAGPTVAGCLTRFGAEVIKIDPTRPDFDPFITVMLSLQSARGKASMLLDLSSGEGQAALARMAASADLITFNGTQAQIDALGLGIDRLARLNPSIVLAQVSAFGGPTPAPHAGRKGVDEVLQAAIGVMHRLQSEAAPPEEYAHYGTIDVATGVWGAVAAIAGLIGARATGGGGQVGTSLAAGAAAVQMPFLWASTAEGPAPEPADSSAISLIDAGRIEGDGYLAPGGQREPLARYADLRSSLALVGTEGPTAVGFARHEDHPIGRPVELVTQCAIACREAPLVTPGHPSKYGADTRSALTRFGMTEDDIAQLLACGAAAESWPNHDQVLPD
jgi:crotonobetainyl-CoA:carnitine CoA-transferase CaiB-like acyl-CoA transferase